MSELKPNTLLADSVTGMVPLNGMDSDTAWDTAMDVVDYPVYITPAFYQMEGEYINANGSTNTGRDKVFNLVVVDKLRKGTTEAIGVVTGLYGTVKTASVYDDLREQLKDIDQSSSPVSVYVSGTGGTQHLVVSVDGMDSMTLPDPLEMRIRLDTSVDGTKAHTLTMFAHDKEGDTSIAVYGGDYKKKARHTTTVSERTVNFIPALMSLLAQWNEMVIPYMQLINDCTFNRDEALKLVEKLAEQAGIGERHAEKMVELYTSNEVNTKATADSLYRVAYVMNQYLDEALEDKTELRDKFKQSIAKGIDQKAKAA